MQLDQGPMNRGAPAVSITRIAGSDSHCLNVTAAGSFSKLIQFHQSTWRHIQLSSIITATG
jgi:hypothetical protein